MYMYMNISYINMCKLNKNREWRKEWETGVSGDGVCGCSLGEPLKQQETSPLPVGIIGSYYNCDTSIRMSMRTKKEGKYPPVYGTKIA
jgi:hypothetical protein